MSQLLQLSPGVDYAGNPLPHPSGVDFSGLPESLATTLQNVYEQIYLQHDRNQFGDATYSWSQLTRTSDTALHNLGAMGRFLHPVYGQIHARYVQFVDQLDQLWTGTPVGYADRIGGFRWQVTNNRAKSNVNALAGLQAAFATPENGQYGWVIVEGINTQSLQYIGDERPVIGSLLSWGSSGFVTQADAPVLGRVVSNDKIDLISAGRWAIPPAAVHITQASR